MIWVLENSTPMYIGLKTIYHFYRYFEVYLSVYFSDNNITDEELETVYQPPGTTGARPTL